MEGGRAALEVSQCLYKVSLQRQVEGQGAGFTAQPD